MKIAKLKIENFRSFKSETINFQDLVVLIGENNAGKSNILKSLELFFSNTKTLNEEFFNDKTKPIIIQIAFNRLSETAKEQFSKYLLDDNETVIIKKEYYFLPEKDMRFYAVIFEEKIDRGGTKEKKSEITKIASGEEIFSLTTTDKTYFWKEKPFGWTAVATGYLPDFLYVPAVKEATDETKISDKSRFGLLINAMLDTVLENETLVKVNNEFARLLMGDDQNQNGRIKQLKEFEQELSAKLSKHMRDASLKLDVAPPSIKDIFQKGTTILIHDGVTTPLELKGHGMQRSVIFVIFQAYAEFLKRRQEEESSKSLIFGFEEPELYLHPQMQRTMFSILKEISKVDQVIFTTHSSFFVEVVNYRSIGIVVKRNLESGTRVVQYQDEVFPQEEEKKQFQLLNEFDPERNEMFFGKKVVLVEGDTEKVIFPLIAAKMNSDYIFHESGITVVECGGKGFIPLFCRVLNCFQIPYVAIYDKDNDSSDSTNRMIEECVNSSDGAGRAEALDPNFEGICSNAGIQFPTNKNKAFTAYKIFKELNSGSIPTRLQEIVKAIFS